jgi:hypothetical protein
MLKLKDFRRQWTNLEVHSSDPSWEVACVGLFDFNKSNIHVQLMFDEHYSLCCTRFS